MFKTVSYFTTNLFYSHQRFDNHWWSSSGTVSSLLGRWRGEQPILLVTEGMMPTKSPTFKTADF